MPTRLTPVRVGLSLMTTEDFRAASLPLFADGVVDALEWSPDMLWAPCGERHPEPAWCAALLDHYEHAGRLSGHGVHLSAFSAEAPTRHERWFARLAGDPRRYRRFSEHVGFMSAPGFADGAPLPVPRCAETVALGAAALTRIARVTGVPAGLENLALAFSESEAWEQGPMLADILSAASTASTAEAPAFLVLDLHNLWCQAVNFAIDPERLLAAFPLERVRELHVSGGSWSHPRADPLGRRFRRDTHDGAVPDEVLALIEPALARCPLLEDVFLERLGGTMLTEDERGGFRTDFMRLRALVYEAAHA